MRRFTMFRRGDLSATHNAEQANAPDVPQFEGVVFSDGTVAIRWLTALRSTSVWADLATALGVHGHPEERYRSEIVWHDSPPAPQSAPIPPIREDVERAVEEHGEACYEVGFVDADRDLREAPVARRNAARAHLLSLFPSGGTVFPAVPEAPTDEAMRYALDAIFNTLDSYCGGVEEKSSIDEWMQTIRRACVRAAVPEAETLNTGDAK